MMVVDKSSEPDATGALLKLKQKEQETEKEARKQFKGLFDKKPGEISEVGVESEDGKNASDIAHSGEAVTNADRDAGAKAGPDAEPGYAFQQERPGLLGRIWPSAKGIFLLTWSEQVHNTLKCFHYATVATRTIAAKSCVELSDMRSTQIHKTNLELFDLDVCKLYHVKLMNEIMRKYLPF